MPKSESRILWKGILWVKFALLLSRKYIRIENEHWSQEILDSCVTSQTDLRIKDENILEKCLTLALSHNCAEKISELAWTFLIKYFESCSILLLPPNRIQNWTWNTSTLEKVWKFDMTYFPENKQLSVTSRPSTATVWGGDENVIFGENCFGPPATTR